VKLAYMAAYNEVVNENHNFIFLFEN